MKIGDSFGYDTTVVDDLVEQAVALHDSRFTKRERCHALAKTLDVRNPRSPSTNGLLAIAVDRLAEITRERREDSGTQS